jgi:membrane protease YdiL (CAAX protease family)
MMNGSALPRSPGKFFLLTFAISVPFWLAAALARQFSVALPFGLPVIVLQVVCPLLAALILVYREEGRRGITGLLKRLIDGSRIRPRTWFVPVILLLPFIYLLSYGIMRLQGRELPEWNVSLPTIAVAVALFLVLAACEEAGWTGYAYDPLEARSNALSAALMLGVVWAVWHIPGDLTLDNNLGFIAWQRIYTVALRVLIVWLYNNTARSVLAALVFHATDNISYALFPNMGSHYDPAIIATITAVAAALVAYLWGPRTLAQYRFARPPATRPAAAGR